MDLNQFLFPAPTASYNSVTHLGELIYIPKYTKDKDGKVQQFERTAPRSQKLSADMIRPLSPKKQDRQVTITSEVIKEQKTVEVLEENEAVFLQINM